MLVDVDGASLHVLREGDPRYGTRLFLSGLGCEAGMWNPVVRALKAAGDRYQHVGFDPQGIGRSTGWPSSVQQLAGDAAAVLSGSTNTRGQVVAHSCGCATAVELATRHPSLRLPHPAQLSSRVQHHHGRPHPRACSSRPSDGRYGGRVPPGKS